MQLLDRVTELHENGAEEVTGVRTGYFDLDRMTAGFQPGDLIVLAARPSMGKTAFALNIAEHVAVSEGLPVVVFSMEMGAAQLALRLVGSLGRIDQQHLRTGALKDDEWGRLSEAVEKLGSVSMFIDESPALTPSEVRARARRQARQCGQLGLIVVDYLQLMSGSGGSSDENRATVIGEISRGLKSLAKELQVPGDRAVAAQPQRRDPHRQAPDDERPARVGRDRAGRRRHHVHLPRRLLHQGSQQGAGRRRDHHRQAAQRADRHRQAVLQQAADQVRQPGTGQRRRRLLKLFDAAGAMTHRRAVFTMIAVTLMWSIAGVVTRHLEAARSFEVTFWRSAFTVITLAVLLPALRGRDGAGALAARRRPHAVALRPVLERDVHRLHGRADDDDRGQRAGDDGDLAAAHRAGRALLPRPPAGHAHLGRDRRRRHRHRVDVCARGQWRRCRSTCSARRSRSRCRSPRRSTGP